LGSICVRKKKSEFWGTASGQAPGFPVLSCTSDAGQGWRTTRPAWAGPCGGWASALPTQLLLWWGSALPPGSVQVGMGLPQVGGLDPWAAPQRPWATPSDHLRSVQRLQIYNNSTLVGVNLCGAPFPSFYPLSVPALVGIEDNYLIGRRNTTINWDFEYNDFLYGFYIVKNRPLYVNFSIPLCAKCCFPQGSIRLVNMRFCGHVPSSLTNTNPNFLIPKVLQK
jgi:hypothetical protein